MIRPRQGGKKERMSGLDRLSGWLYIEHVDFYLQHALHSQSVGSFILVALD